MKTKSTLLTVFTLFGILIYSSCNLIDSEDKPLGGEPSAMGEVNNTFDVFVSSFPGVSNASAKVTAQNGNISTIKYSATITNTTVLNLAKAMPDVTVNGNVVSVSRDYRITTNGFQSVYEEGDLTIMDYDAKVGDKYTLKHDGNTLVREVKKVSNTDEYQWGFMLIKTIHIEETGRNIPGVSKIEFIGNHKWGMVGIVLHFEDGSQKTLGIFSDASN